LVVVEEERAATTQEEVITTTTAHFLSLLFLVSISLWAVFVSGAKRQPTT
jgi:hypothetical protein